MPVLGSVARGGRVNKNNAAMRKHVNSNPGFVTKAKLEIIEADECMLAQPG